MQYLTANAARSRIADAFCSQKKGRAVSCTLSGIMIEIQGRGAFLPYEEVRSAIVTEGRFWATLELSVADNEVRLVSGLPKATAHAVNQVLQKNLSLAHSVLLEQLRAPLNDLSAALTRLTSGEQYVSAFKVRSFLQRAQALSTLFDSRSWPGISLGAHQEKLERVKAFREAHERLTPEINQRFVAHELKGLKSFFDTIEGKPLTVAQRRAVVVNEDRNLVVAAAGSGKTSVIVAKVAHLLKRGLRDPSEVLVLAFARDAAKELSDRIESRVGASVSVNTFHALGLYIVAAVDGKAPSVSRLAEDQSQFSLFIRQQILRLIESDNLFASTFLIWFQSHFVAYRSLWEFASLGEYYQYLRDCELRTLGGERVRSFEECEIANWLYLNGIEYQYEPRYEHDVATRDRRQYKPDFFLPELALYVEHFGIDQAGHTPPFIDEKEYRASMDWKRATHKRFGTALIETYSYEKRAGTLLSGLRQKIEAISGRSLDVRPLSPTEAFSTLEENGRVDEFSRLVATFLRHLKSGQLTGEELQKRVLAMPANERALAFLKVFSPIFEVYQKTLTRQGEIDFEDMITLATKHVLSGRFTSAYGYILVDEFQDISVGRAKLLNALLQQRPDSQLFVVGDDWQSIYRFAGSDISVMRNFSVNFGVTAQTYLEETFRFNNRIASVASRFVLRNKGQIAKTVRAIAETANPSVFIMRSGLAAKANGLRDALSRIADEVGDVKVGVLIIGRYNHLKPDDLSATQAAFPSLRLRFKTVHGSKGLEDDYVVVLGLRGGRMGFPSEIVDDPLLDLVLAAGEPYPHAEERRLLYVAMTRAKRAVYLMSDTNAPSAFVNELCTDGYDVCELGEVDRGKPRCPVCKEGKLRVRSGEKGSFVGCSFFPLCEYTEAVCPSCRDGVVQRVGGRLVCGNGECGQERQVCPTCGEGWLLARRRKDGTRSFLGCSQYPRCSYTENIHQ